MKKLIIVCLILSIIVILPVAANPIDDLFGFIFGPTENDMPIFTNDTYVWNRGTITNASYFGDVITVEWANDPLLSADEQRGLINLYCDGNSNNPVWSGMAYGYSGKWEVNTVSEVKITDVKTCYVNLVDGVARDML
jgi:hypothetical protein